MRNLAWQVPILAYHRVGTWRDDHVPTVSAEAFARQLSLMRAWGFQSAELDDVLAVVEGRRRMGPRQVVITFDDGYEETATVVAPLLHQCGFRGTVFVTPGEVGMKGFMSWEQVRAIANNGMTIGSHTQHHVYLPMVTTEKATVELQESKTVLEQQLNQPVRWLSYPVGGFTSMVQQVARTVGYEAACTTNRGRSKFSTDRFALRRIKMTDRDRHPLLLSAKLSGYYNLFRRLEQPA